MQTDTTPNTERRTLADTGTNSTPTRRAQFWKTRPITFELEVVK